MTAPCCEDLPIAILVPIQMGALLRTQEKDLHGPKGHSYPVQATELVATGVTQIKHSPAPQVAESWVRSLWAESEPPGFDSQHSGHLLLPHLRRVSHLS